MKLLTILTEVFLMTERGLLSLLEAIAACDGTISKAEQEKLDAIKSELGV